MQRVLTFMVILCFSVSYSQLKIPKDFDGSKKQIESIILQEEALPKDSAAFHNSIRPLSESTDPILQSVHQIFLANWTAAKTDRLNSRSDNLFKNAMKIASEAKDEGLQLWTTTEYAAYLYKYRDYENLINPMLFVYKEAERIPERKIIQPYETYRFIGWTLSTFKDYPAAIEVFEKARKFIKSGSREDADLLCFLGNAYKELNQNSKAERKFLQSAEISKKTGHDSRHAKALGYLADLELEKGNKNKAKDLLKEDIRISEKVRDSQNTLFALIQLSKIYLSENNTSEAFRWLQAAKSISESKTYFRSSEKEVLTLELEILEKTPGKDDELNIRRRLQVLDDSLKRADGEMQVNRINWLLQKSKYDRAIQNTNSLAKRQSLFKNVFLGLVVISFIILIFIVLDRRKLQKHKADYLLKVQDYESEKEKLESQLNSTKLDFENQIDYISKKNEQITLLNAELEHLKNGRFNHIEENSGRLADLLESHLMTEENWLNFKKAFIMEDPETYHKIASYSEITESNLRIILLQKLGYGNTEIAGLLGITTDAVKKSKQRLRKKLGEKSDSLEELLSAQLV